VIERAPAELTELAAAVRPDWHRDSVASAITTATASGMPWPRILAEMTRLMCRENGTPRELLDLSADVRRSYSHDPDAYRAGLAAARQAIGRAS
jgi:hypothetical protein